MNRLNRPIVGVALGWALIVSAVIVGDVSPPTGVADLADPTEEASDSGPLFAEAGGSGLPERGGRRAARQVSAKETSASNTQGQN